MKNTEKNNNGTNYSGPRRADPKTFHEDAYLSVEWLKHLGLAPPSSRYDQYLHELDRPESEVRSIDIDSNDAKRVACAHYELIELTKIRKNLQDIDPSSYKNQLDKISSGHIYRNTTAKDQSRDFLFELSIASRFKKSGFHINVSGPADTQICFEDTTIFVEAKRPRSVKKLAKRVEHANKQIARRLVEHRSHRRYGIVFIDATEMINPENKIEILRSPP